MIRFTKTHCLVLCPLGHLISVFDLKDWAGSLMESEVVEYQHGTENRLSRLMRSCDGFGHQKEEE